MDFWGNTVNCKMNVKYLSLVIIGILGLANAADILVVIPWPFYSHYNCYTPIIRELAKRGHNITMVSSLVQNEPVPNITEIILPNMKQELLAMVPNENFVAADGFLFRLFGMWQIGLMWMNATLHQDSMKAVINDKTSKYDLIMAETGFFQEILLAFGHKYGTPFINFAPAVITPMFLKATGNHLPASFVPVVKLPFTDRMNYLERVMNFFFYYWDVIIGEFYYLRKQEALMREHFIYPGSENLPPLIDMIRNTSLTLVDTSSAVGYQAPYMQNILEVGGLNLKNVKKLPSDLQEIMDEAVEGVIFFSLGSHIQISSLTAETQLAIFTALGKLKQKIFMKMENTHPYFNNTSSNILTRTWFPQTSILAHENCKLFITHGGIHSLMESVYFKVPLMVIPLIYDQYTNAKFIEVNGIGASITLDQLTEYQLLSKINALLNNVSIKKNLDVRSEMLKMSVEHGLENAIYWIEHVIRYKGAQHLRPALSDLYWFQYLMLDVLFFYLIVLIIIYWLIKRTINFIREYLLCDINVFNQKTKLQ